MKDERTVTLIAADTDTNNGDEDVTSIMSLIKSKPQGTVECMAQEVPGF